ncbi:MAG TPA: nucleotidyltransferase domain-containing protein, partial [Candidatus Angelobacter sp.]|nr:nucleotidyltransferase domain-containing protein [Candidatus Angelobacter sp.]
HVVSTSSQVKKRTSKDRSLLELVAFSGFDRPQMLIHLFVGGSELHGAKIGRTDDTDLYGVYIEDLEQALGLEPREHFVWSTAGDERRNGPDDIDVMLYSLRKWAGMAAKGNATALHFLFAEPQEVAPEIWRKIQAERGLFLSRSSAKQFLGFANDQFKRLTGEKGSGKKGQRPEYIGKSGYDTKAAMHGLRLLYECLELMKYCQITLPRPEKDLLIEVRSGEWTLDRVLAHANNLAREVEKAVASSPLPESVDRAAISSLVAQVHLEFWKHL